MGKFWASDGDPAHIDKAFELAGKALSVNSMDSFAHGSMSLATAYKNRFDLAMTHADEALKLNRNNLLTAKNRGVWLLFLGRNVEALAAFDDVLRRDPYPPSSFWEARGAVLYQLGRYEEALMTFHKNPEPQVWERAYIVACLMKLRREVEAKSEFVKLLAQYPKASITQSRLKTPAPLTLAGRL
jgi:tetratricopeptide (TPR) repeat protein